MKKIFPLALLILLPAVASADSTLWRLTAFKAAITVREDGFTEVSESLGAEFLQERHGIYRYVPQSTFDGSGRQVDLGLTLVSVTLDGKDEPVQGSESAGNAVWRIGREDVTMTGAHAYEVSYRARRAVRFYEDHDELYWNVTGEGWDVPLPLVEAAVALPAGVPKESVKTACFTGPYGSTEHECSAEVSGQRATFRTLRPGLPLTVVVGWPKGFVTPPPPTLSETLRDRVFGPGTVGWYLGYLVLPALLSFMLRRWWRVGRERDSGPVVAQYEAPDNLTPAELSALMRQSVSNQDLAPTIVDLAVKGFIRIEETKTKGVFGIAAFGVTGYILHRLDRAKEGSLKPFEQKLLVSLFGSSDQRDMDDLKGKFVEDLRDFKDEVMDALVVQGYFDHKPSTVRTRYVLLALLGLPLAFGSALLGAYTWAAGFVLAVPLVGIIGWQMPRWSQKGSVAAWHGSGYREFIRTVEKHRAPWMETQGMFEKTLPFALAFGLGEKWTKAFEGLHLQQPSWYAGPLGYQFAAASFGDDLSRATGSFTAVTAAKPASSGSGFSGGGFSGGGGGGGGGGSW